MVETAPLERLDTFAYRHRVNEIMARPLVTGAPYSPLGEAASRMSEAGVTAVLVTDHTGQAIGIVTQADVVAALAMHGGEAASVPLAAIMSAPVATVRQDALAFVAMGRMERLKLHHVAAVDQFDRAVGLVDSQALLQLRSAHALAIGDELDTATSGEEMRAVRSRLPGLVRALRAEGIAPASVAEVTTSILREITSRAAKLAEESMAEDGWGPAPVAWTLLLLGSGGRRESLLAPDQDNAIVHEGDAHHDVWFAEIGRRICRLLDEAGVPFCRANVMAQNENWRRPLSGWVEQIDRWAKAQVRIEAAGCDVFADLRPVYGSTALAEKLRKALLERVHDASDLLHHLAEVALSQAAPLGVLGQFKTRDGRIGLKTMGMMPLVSAVRVLALRHQIPATSTTERLSALVTAGAVDADSAATLTEACNTMMSALFEQQVQDAANGQLISSRVDAKRLPPQSRSDLKDALRSLSLLPTLISASMPGSSIQSPLTRQQPPGIY